MAYVDLNPVRAGMVQIPETSDYTSIVERAKAAKQPDSSQPHDQLQHLLPFVGYPRKEMLAGLPFRLADYLELVGNPPDK